MTDPNEEIITSLRKSFAEEDVLLYVGMNGSSMLSESLCKLQWCGVLTSSIAGDFGKEFIRDGRDCKRISSINDFPIRPFSRTQLNMFQLFGTVGENVRKSENDEMQRRRAINGARQFFEKIVRKMDNHGTIVFLGYDAENEKEYPADELLFLLEENPGVKLYFFRQEGDFFYDVESNENHIFHGLSAKWGFQEDLSLLDDNEDLYDFERVTSSQSELLLYKSGKPITIAKQELLHGRNVFELLTEDGVNRVRPYGRVEQAKWFSNFLLYSSEVPQWYGYFPQTEFYIKRDYEEALIACVRKLLDNQWPSRQTDVTPVILQGAPGSSKSVELAALAYQIYSERVHPVIFINGNNNAHFGTDSSTEFRDLAEVMETIDKTDGKNEKFLIVWDCSSYKDVASDARRLARLLENRGRRFVLVCSAYEQSHDSSSMADTGRYWHVTYQGIQGAKQETANVIYADGCYYVSSSREMSEREEVQLRQKIKNYDIADPELVTKRWDLLKKGNEKNLFIYLYQLIWITRPGLEKGLSREQQIVEKYVIKQLDKIGGPGSECSNFFGNQMEEALKKAGIVLHEKDKKRSVDSEDAGMEESRYDLDSFHNAVALFSKHKVRMPYGLASRMLYRSENTSTWSEEAREIFKLITTAFPYLNYQLDEDSGDAYVAFRNSLEAAILLEKNNVSAEKIVEIVCRMLDIYAEDYRQNEVTDPDMGIALASLLRVLGPNSSYTPYNSGGEEYANHRNFLKLLDKITEKLRDLRVNHDVPDGDGQFANIEITFTREYYGKLYEKLSPNVDNEDSYLKRLSTLRDATVLASEYIEALEGRLRSTENNSDRQYLNNQINSLRVEMCLCSNQMNEIKKDCELAGYDLHQNPYINVKILSYDNQYRILMKAIASDPSNGYLYNTLFKSFLAAYQATKSRAEQIRILSDIRLIVDDVMSLEIQSRGMNGSDELSSNVNKIVVLSDEQRITIAALESGVCAEEFTTLFYDMLSHNNPSSICFVAQSELDAAGLTGNAIQKWQKNNEGEFVLDKEQHEVCERVLNFLQNPEYENCINSSPAALYLMLRVAWMYFDGRILSTAEEGQATYISYQGWREINQICEKFLDCSNEGGRPIVVLIKALSMIQMNQNDPETYRKAVRVVDSLSKDAFINTHRMRVPFLICNEPGIQKEYTATVKKVNGYNGEMSIGELASSNVENLKVRFYSRKLGLTREVSKGDTLTVSLGIGYTGFSAYQYKPTVREERSR